MLLKFKAIKSLHRFYDYNKQLLLRDFQVAIGEGLQAERKYDNAVKQIDAQAKWKASSEAGALDLTLYAESIKYEDFAIRHANNCLSDLNVVKEKIADSRNHLVEGDVQVKTISRRLTRYAHQIDNKAEKSQFDSLTDQNNAFEATLND